MFNIKTKIRKIMDRTYLKVSKSLKKYIPRTLKTQTIVVKHSKVFNVIEIKGYLLIIYD